MFGELKAFLNQWVKPSGIRPSYSNNLEAYRGLCAILVMLNHGATHETILLDSFTWPIFIKYINSGYLSVLCFFCISGYAIGSSNYLQTLNVKAYLKKRVIRLYPIYIIAFLFCLFVATQLPLIQLVQNLLFLQNSSPYFNYQIPVFVNFVTWSLNYEILYYLVFIGIASIRSKIWPILLVMLLLSLILIHPKHGLEFFANYNNGFYFWILGLLFGWNLMGEKLNNKQEFSLLSILFLHLCINYLGTGMIILNFLGINSNTNLNWLFDLPFCLMIMSTLLGYQSIIFKINKFITYTIPCIAFAYLFFNNRIFENERWIMCVAFWALSLLIYRERLISKLMLSKMVFIGQMSYGIYLFHLPVALLIKKYIVIGNQNLEVAIKYLLWITLTLFISFITEKIIQPKIKNYLSKDARPVAPIF